MTQPLLTSMCALLALVQAPSTAELVARWSAATTVRYRVVGEYSGPTVIAYREPAGQATVTDRVVLEFTWDLKAQQLVGEATVDNRPSTVAGLRNTHPSCPAPTPAGDYEHLTVAAVKSANGRLELTGTRAFPEVAVVAGCQGVQEPRKVGAWEQEVVERLTVPSPLMLAAPPGTDANLTVNADRTAFTLKDGAWTWTFTPAPAAG